jgi:2-dehydropantoate 2-reductase
VIPLLNGIDHVERLREAYGERVVPGVIRVESERVAPGHVVQPGPFIAIDLAPPPSLDALAEQIAADVETAGIACSLQGSGADILWRKLALLAPLALATTSARAPIGSVRGDGELRGLLLDCAREVSAVAATQGVAVDPDRVCQALLGLPPDMRSSMQKDLARGDPVEVEAIGGPVMRVGAAHGVPTPATAELVRRVEALAAAGASGSANG